jgi:hypothetical protein
MNDNYTKMSALIEYLKTGCSPIIRWIDPFIEEFESYDVGMICRAIGIKETDFALKSSGIVIYGITTDFSEFEEYNKSIAKETWNYSSDDSSKQFVKWHESSFYPKDRREVIYLQLAEEFSGEKSSGCMFEFVNTSSLSVFEKYKESKTELPYVAWLEKAVFDSDIYFN